MTQTLNFLTLLPFFACKYQKKALPLHSIWKNMYTLEEIQRPIESELRIFEKEFVKELSSENQQFNELLQYIHQGRGKQLRPKLVLLSAALCQGITDKTIKTALALELLHTSTLIHDDVVDDSPTRRGLPALHARWNNKVAVLTGDYMLARVIQLVAETRNTQILNIVAQMGQDLSAGELLQLHNGQSMWISEQQYLQVIEQKTAQLFRACCEAGAASCMASPRQTKAMIDFGLALGMCFQLKDDILDFSDAEEIGKPTMNDIRDGKVTLPLLISMQRATKEEAETMRELCEALAEGRAHIKPDEAEQQIRNFVLRYDGIRYAYQMIEKYRVQALHALSAFRDTPEQPSQSQRAREALVALLEYAICREK